ncbi:MAG: hypothetical protein ABI423_06745, partial [Burkholderiales bacterium]
GGDWPAAKIVVAAEVLARGGAVHSIPFEHQRSTTALMERIGALKARARKRPRPAPPAKRKARAARSRARRKAR